MIERIAVPGSRLPIYRVTKGSGVIDQLIAGSMKAAKALKGPALQLVKTIPQQMVNFLKPKAQQILQKYKRKRNPKGISPQQILQKYQGENQRILASNLIR